jgi:hypothetical protein
MRTVLGWNQQFGGTKLIPLRNEIVSEGIFWRYFRVRISQWGGEDGQISRGLCTLGSLRRSCLTLRDIDGHAVASR